MSDTLTFCTSLLSYIGSWLSTEPMIYFTGVALGCFTFKTIYNIFH